MDFVAEQLEAVTGGQINVGARVVKDRLGVIEREDGTLECAAGFERTREKADSRLAFPTHGPTHIEVLQPALGEIVVGDGGETILALLRAAFADVGGQILVGRHILGRVEPVRPNGAIGILAQRGRWQVGIEDRVDLARPPERSLAIAVAGDAIVADLGPEGHVVDPIVVDIGADAVVLRFGLGAGDLDAPVARGVVGQFQFVAA